MQNAALSERPTITIAVFFENAKAQNRHISCGSSRGLSGKMKMRPDHLSSLESAIKIRYKCRPTHRETVFVQEKACDNQTIWQGNVEVFNLEDHDRAKTCYAWQHMEERGGVKIFAVLGNEIIRSPSRAVQAAIFVDAQPPEIQPVELESGYRDDEFHSTPEMRGFVITAE